MEDLSGWAASRPATAQFRSSRLPCSLYASRSAWEGTSRAPGLVNGRAQWKAALDRGAQAAELSPASQQAARISGPIHLTPRALDLAPGDAAERMAEPEPAPAVGGAASPGGI